MGSNPASDRVLLHPGARCSVSTCFTRPRCNDRGLLIAGYSTLITIKFAIGVIMIEVEYPTHTLSTCASVADSMKQK